MDVEAALDAARREVERKTFEIEKLVREAQRRQRELEAQRRDHERQVRKYQSLKRECVAVMRSAFDREHTLEEEIGFWEEENAQLRGKVND